MDQSAVAGGGGSSFSTFPIPNSKPHSVQHSSASPVQYSFRQVERVLWQARHLAISRPPHFKQALPDVFSMIQKWRW